MRKLLKIVLDAKTNLPIESASVYFDNTTLTEYFHQR
jgi:hypothetical protein